MSGVSCIISMFILLNYHSSFTSLYINFCFSLFIAEVNQDCRVVNITPQPLYLQELNGDETHTLLKNITANIKYRPLILHSCIRQFMCKPTDDCDVSHFTNPCMFTPIIQLVLFFIFIINLITFP